MHSNPSCILACFCLLAPFTIVCCCLLAPFTIVCCCLLAPFTLLLLLLLLLLFTSSIYHCLLFTDRTDREGARGHLPFGVGCPVDG